MWGLLTRIQDLQMLGWLYELCIDICFCCNFLLWIGVLKCEVWGWLGRDWGWSWGVNGWDWGWGRLEGCSRVWAEGLKMSWCLVLGVWCGWWYLICNWEDFVKNPGVDKMLPMEIRVNFKRLKENFRVVSSLALSCLYLNFFHLP